jgi:hypothetical protein
LIASTASQRSAGKLSIGAVCWMPALLTRCRPSRAVLRCLHHLTNLVGLRHVGAAVDHLDPNSRARPRGATDLSGIAEAVEHQVDARAPRLRAMPRPMPLVEPVTMAHCPCNISIPRYLIELVARVSHCA